MIAISLNLISRVCEAASTSYLWVMFLGAIAVVSAPALGSDTISKGSVPTVAKLPLGLSPFPKTAEDPVLIAYGSFLFQSDSLSIDQSLSCTSCHVPALGFSGSTPVAIGVRGQLGRRHPPPLINLYFDRQFMLDGRAANLVDQIHMPIESATEMDADWPTILKRLAAAPETRQVLPRTSQGKLDKVLVVNSLAAYVQTLVSGDSPFDRFYYAGDQQAISEQAKEGLALFVRKARCSGCHLITGYDAPLTDSSFHATGVGFENGAYTDVGRYGVTGAEADRGAFKTPTLRNVADRRFFMHDGSMNSLRQVIDYYNKGGNRNATNLDGRIRPLFLTELEIEAMIEFLRTLSAPVVSYRPEP